MAIVWDVKKLGKDKQISYRSIPQIVTRLDLVAAKLAVARSFLGAKLRTGHLVNAVALWLIELSDEELARQTGPMLDRLEAYLMEPEQVPAPEPEPAPQPAIPPEPTEKLPGVQLPSKRARRPGKLEPNDPAPERDCRKILK